MTSYEAMDIIYLYLNNATFLNSIALTGGMYKIIRPVSSDKEDIVLNCLGLPNEDVQEGIINVNFFVPNLVLQIDGKQDVSQPDFERLKAGTLLIIQRLNEFFKQDYWFYYQQQTGPFADGDSQYYSNVRIKFNSYNA